MIVRVVSVGRGETSAEPACECIAKGRPMTAFGVQHAVECEWVEWFMATGGVVSHAPSGAQADRASGVGGQSSAKNAARA